MTLDQLRCLRAVVEQGRFRAAADSLHLSQPAVSKQLKSLERELGGQPLIDRKTARPTALGVKVYERASRILLDTEALQAELLDQDDRVERELRLGSSDTTALYLLPEYLRLLSTRMSRTHITLINRSSDGIADLVAKGGVDLGIVTLPMARPDLEERPLFQQRLVVVLPADHRLARRRSLTLEMLAGEPVLQLDQETRTGSALGEFFMRQHFTPRVVLDSGSFEVIKRYIAERLGISFLPESVIRREDSQLVSRPLDGLPEISIGAIWRRGGYLSHCSRALLELMQAREAQDLSRFSTTVPTHFGPVSG